MNLSCLLLLSPGTKKWIRNLFTREGGCFRATSSMNDAFHNLNEAQNPSIVFLEDPQFSEEWLQGLRNIVLSSARPHTIVLLSREKTETIEMRELKAALEKLGIRTFLKCADSWLWMEDVFSQTRGQSLSAQFDDWSAFGAENADDH